MIKSILFYVRFILIKKTIYVLSMNVLSYFLGFKMFINVCKREMFGKTFINIDKRVDINVCKYFILNLISTLSKPFSNGFLNVYKC